MSDTEAEVSVPLTVEDRAFRAESMASIVLEIRAIKAQAKAKALEFREAIEAHMQRLEEHARVLMEGEENRRQMALTFPAEEAARALHDVAKAACSCDDTLDTTDPGAASPDCPVHGDEAAAKRLAAAGLAVLHASRCATSPETGEPGPCDCGAAVPLDGSCSCASAEIGDPDCKVHGVARRADGTAKDVSEREPEPVGELVEVGHVDEPVAVEEFKARQTKRRKGGAA